MNNKIKLKEVKDLIELNNKYELRNFIELNDIEFKRFNSKDFNIIKYTKSLYNNGKISFEVKKIVLINYDKQRKEVIDILFKNNINELKKYVEINKIEFNKYCFPDMDIYKLVFTLFNQGYISAEIRDIVLIHSDNKRYHVVKLILENNIRELKKYLYNNYIDELKVLNDKYFHLTKYCTQYNKNKFNKIKKNIEKQFNKKGYDISELKSIKKRNDLKKYIIENFDKFDNYTQLIEESESYIKQIMLNFVHQHFDKRRNFIINLIKRDDFEKLKKYIKKYVRINKFAFKDLNDNYFNIIKYCKSRVNNISPKMFDFVILNFSIERINVLEFIKKNQIDGLKTYLKKNKIELKKLNDNYFNIVEYCNKKEKEVSNEMRNFIISHLNSLRFEIVELMNNSMTDNNKIKELEKYIEKSKIDLKDLNDEYFDILNYCDNGSYHRDIKKIINDNYDTEVKHIKDFLENNDTEGLLNYMTKKDVELKSFNNKHFNIIKFCQDNNKINKETEIFVINNYTLLRSNIIRLFEMDDTEDIDDFDDFQKSILNEKDFELQDVNDNNFDLNRYFKSIKIKSQRKKDFLKKFYNKLEHIKKILNEKDKNENKKLEEIKKYCESFEYGFEFKEFIKKKNFDMVHYTILLYNKKIISDDIKDYILLNFDHELKKFIITMNDRNIVDDKKRYIMDNFFKENKNKIDSFRDTYNNIIKYVPTYTINISNEILSYIELVLDHRKNNIIKLIQGKKENRINQLKKYMEKYFISFEPFHILEYIKDEKIELTGRMKDFIITHYTINRYKVMELILSNDVDELKKYLDENKDFELHKLNDEHFDLITYIYSSNPYNFITFEMCKFVITHLTKDRCKIIEFIENKNINEIKKFYQKDKSIFENLNDKHFDFLNYLFNLSDNDERIHEIKQYILSHYNPIIKEIIKKIKKKIKKDDDKNKLKHYIKKNINKLTNEDIKIIKQYFINSDLSSNIKKYIIRPLYTEKYYTLIQLIQENNLLEFKNYVEENNFEFKEFNNKIFNFFDYYNIDEIKKFIKMQNIDLEKIEKEIKIFDIDFNILKYFKYILKINNKNNNNIDEFILSHKNKNRFSVVELISLVSSVYQLRKYIKKYNIELRDLDDQDFSLIKYCKSEINQVKPYMCEFVINHYHKLRGDTVDIIIKNKNNTQKLEKHLEERKIILKELNDKYFDIIKFSESISEKIKKYVISHLYTERSVIVNFARKGEKENIELYLKSESMKTFEIKEIDDEEFSIIDYCKDKSNNIKSDVTKFIINHYDKNRHAVVEILENEIDKNNNIEALENYIKDNKIEFKNLIDKNFNIFEFCYKLELTKDIKKYIIYDCIIHHYDNKLWKLKEIIDELDFIKLQKYIENQNIVLNEYDIVINYGNESKKYFSTINYIFELFDNISQLSPKQKEYLKSRINRNTCDLVKELNNNHYKEFVDFIKNKRINLIEFCNSDFDILKYSIINNVSSQYINFIINQFDKNYSSLQSEFIKKLIYRNPISDFELNKIIKNENKKIIISQSLLILLITEKKFEIINKLIKKKLIYMNDYDEKIIKPLYKINKLNENNLNHLIDNDYDIEKLIKSLKMDDYELVKKLIKNDSDKMKSIMRIIDKDHIFDNDCILRFLIIQHNNSPISTKDLKSEIKKEKKKFIKKLCNVLFY
ncbi:hypothetical protein BCR32DRAFT_272633 [Anaeromyces robustus]|uniref:Uncharacterized protein n=1 Tax=Anaeromyces robustus TaxID=1754192 RepID=A0A1Y1VZH3_9FUNG|nr:hypothetical protein BCR32DRAFT_272633 [Anaeromyces robustus]|eukprot:ORX66668.1 hypothetical protein BCR32DRAFT_272633 [Anaeromyces robustus]